MTDAIINSSADMLWLGSAAEWRERSIMLVVGQQLDLIRDELRTARDGFRFDDSSIDVFDHVAATLPELLATGAIEFDPEACERSLKTLYRRIVAEAPNHRSSIAD